MVLFVCQYVKFAITRCISCDIQDKNALNLQNHVAEEDILVGKFNRSLMSPPIEIVKMVAM